MKFSHFLLSVGIACSMILGSAHGHATLEHSTPANNEVLRTAPKSIDLTFGHPTKLVMIKLTKGTDNMLINFTPASTASTTFSIPLPVLTSGKYLATWSTLSDDGHPMKGAITFTIVGS